jgi:hypothetical protein
MSDFMLWFSTGLEHIVDLDGYDHILFVSLLVLSFPLGEWKKLLIVITGFTIGHSISLALSIFNVVNFSQQIIEILIAFTIFLTALYHLIYYKSVVTKRPYVLYLLVPLFGMIHGLGFSYLLRAMLGKEENIMLPLIYFNIGIEAGQLIIVAIVVLFSLFLASIIRWPYQTIKLFVSCTIALITLKMLVERIYQLF